MKLKKILEESNAPGYKDRKFGAPLPTLASIQAAYEAKQGKLTEADLTEGIQSNIMQKWGDEKTIVKDLIQYVDEAVDAGGADLVEDIYNALSQGAKYAMKVYKQEYATKVHKKG